MSPDLPPALVRAVSSRLEGVSRNAIAERSDRLSAAYRAGNSSTRAIDDRDDVLAYLLARLPATYAAVAHVLSEIGDRAPSFAPTSLLDAGSGPGTASFAAVEAWPVLARICMVDERQPFLAMAKELSAGSVHPALAHVQQRHQSLISGAGALPHADLVIASYVLAEFDETLIAKLVTTLWQSCEGLLVLIEPGTPAGYRRILSSRSVLLQQSARLVAPCPHGIECPLREPDWCHFSQRLSRSRDHMAVKSAVVPFEDEKFSYLVVARENVTFTGSQARVLAPPRKSKAGLELKLCADGEVRMIAVPRRDKSNYASYRRLSWGDAITTAPQSRD